LKQLDKFGFHHFASTVAFTARALEAVVSMMERRANGTASDRIALHRENERQTPHTSEQTSTKCEVF
jgi:hypothetical protein